MKSSPAGFWSSGKREEDETSPGHRIKSFQLEWCLAELFSEALVCRFITQMEKGGFKFEGRNDYQRYHMEHLWCSIGNASVDSRCISHLNSPLKDTSLSSLLLITNLKVALRTLIRETTTN